MNRMIHSSKFWTAVVAAVFNIAAFVVAHYLPAYNDLAVVVIAGLDGVFAVVIGATAAEDVAQKRALS